MYKVGILYICTGKYSEFWKDFYENCEKKFLLNSDKHYFIWTDSMDIKTSYEHDDNIHIYHQEVEKWPFPTLKRFEYFLQAREDLLKMDYIMYMNGNMMVVDNVKEEELGIGINDLFVTTHPGYYDKSPEEFTYDRNWRCWAHIRKGKGKYYFAGGFSGGTTSEYLKLIEKLAKKTKRDYKRGIIALWHDESYLNRYMLTYKKAYKRLSPAYLYPEGWDIPFEKKIIIIDKNNRGGHDYLRNNG